MAFKKILFRFAFGFLLTFAFCALHRPGRAQEIDTQTSQALKQYMMNLSTLLSDLEAQQMREGPKDWKAIQTKVKAMEETLKNMKKTDSKQAYQKYLNDLEANLNAMETLSEKKDTKTFGQLADLKNACFQCHAAHHSGGYFKGKE